ncbi:MAG: acyl-CoA synthetase FdrA [Spirochaetaceae bacterium]|nr:acyl-CoA synthetase FdrA [Spirochaetaceae bacterium]
MKQVSVVPDAYFDSVFLMSVASQLRELAGVQTGLIVLGTDANREAIAQLGFDAASVGSAGAHDLVIAVDADDAASAARATERARELLHGDHTAPDGSGHEPRSLRSAIHVCESANLALISVPGEFAAREAATALQAGLHAMVFSDNVSLADEIALKEMAHERGLLMMGPDCGTAVINGVPLGFANVVARGSIGMVGASGTGMQEVMCLIDRFGGGISQAVGIGGRDLFAEVGGIMAIDAIDALAADPATEVVTLVAKPSDASVAARVLERLGATGKPAVAALLGARDYHAPATVQVADDLTAAARLAVAVAGADTSPEPGSPAELAAVVAACSADLAPPRRYLRGLFGGGTLAAEALEVVARQVGPVHALHARPGVSRLADPYRSQEHAIIDLGEDLFTRGRPHPMIDSTARNDRLLQEADDPEAAVFLLDFVLGHGSHEDPAGSSAAALRAVRRKAPGAPIIASITGTDADPQNRARQRAALESLGCTVMASNHEAAMLAAGIVQAVRT